MRDSKVSPLKRFDDIILDEQSRYKSVLAASEQELERANFLQQSFLAQAEEQGKAAAKIKARLACQRESVKSNIGQAKAYRAVVGK